MILKLLVSKREPRV